MTITFESGKLSELQTENKLLKAEIREKDKQIELLAKAFVELLELCKEYRERMGIETNSNEFEYQKMEDAGLL
jgi:hypothetical protein